MGIGMKVVIRRARRGGERAEMEAAATGAWQPALAGSPPNAGGVCEERRCDGGRTLSSHSAWRPRFPREHSWLRSASLSFSQAVSPQARAAPSLALPSKLHTPAPRPGVHRHPSQAGVQARGTDHLRRSHSVLSAAGQLLGLLLSPRGSSLAIPLLERGLI